MDCSRCGINLLKNSNFCHACGMPVQTGGDVADNVAGEESFKPKDATTLIWRSDESGVKIKLAASDLSASSEKEEHNVHSIEELVRLIRDQPSAVETVEPDQREMIFHIFTAWR